MAHPIRRLREIAVAAVLKHKARKYFQTPAGRVQEKQMRDFLANRKEVIGKAIVAIIALLTALGFTDWIPVLQKLHDAMAGGDPVAIIGTLGSLAVAVIGIFSRWAKDRKHEELMTATIVAPKL